MRCRDPEELVALGQLERKPPDPQRVHAIPHFGEPERSARCGHTHLRGPPAELRRVTLAAAER